MAEELETQEPLEPIDIIQQSIVSGYPWAEAAAAVAGNPYTFSDTILGFTEGDITDPLAPREYQEGDIPEANLQPILEKDVIDAIPSILDADGQAILAMEMFLNVDSAYGDIDQVFEEDGSVNQDTFLSALETVTTLAAKAGPTGYDTTTKYLNILTSSGGNSLEDLSNKFQDEMAKSSGTFPPIVLNRIVDNGFSNVLGRTASKREQQQFTEMILELEDSIKRSETAVALKAEEFAREENPYESKMMDYRGVGDSIMRVLGFA